MKGFLSCLILLAGGLVACKEVGVGIQDELFNYSDDVLALSLNEKWTVELGFNGGSQFTAFRLLRNGSPGMVQKLDETISVGVVGYEKLGRVVYVGCEGFDCESANVFKIDTKKLIVSVPSGDHFIELELPELYSLPLSDLLK